jgi:hypothetical protein
MAEIKTLQDFYDPTRTGLAAMQVLQGQQHLALQQQQVAQQGKNMEVDNLAKALQTADPMQSYPIYQQLHEKLGLPVQGVNEYYANLPSARVERGAQKLNEIIGVGSDKDLAALTAAKPAIQAQAGNAAFQSPVQQEQFKALKQKVEEHEAVAANVNTQISALLPIAKQAGLGISRATPHVAALEAIQQEYDKNLKSQGLAKAAKIKQERIAVNKDLQQFGDRRLQSIPKMEQTVQQIEDLQSQLETRAELLATGAQPLKEGESLHILAGQVDASHQHLALAKAQLAFAKNPTAANLAAMKTVQEGMEGYLTALTAKKSASQDALALRQGGLDEKKAEYADKKARDIAIGKAQVAWMESGGTLANAHQFAKQFGVHVDEVTKAAKDPNKAGIEIKMPGTTEEAGKFAMMDNAVKNVDAVVKSITKTDGSIDRQKVFSAQFNIPFTEGRDLNSMMEDAISAKLRAETGAAANAEEVKSISKRFNLSSLDSDEVIKSKTTRLRRFLNETRVIRDSTGKIRESASKGEQAQETAPPAAAPSGAVAPFNDSEKERR